MINLLPLIGIFLSLTILFLILFNKEEDLPDKQKTISFFRSTGLPGLVAAGSFFIGSSLLFTPLSGIAMALIGWIITRFVLTRIEQAKRKRIKQQAMSIISTSSTLFSSNSTIESVVESLSENLSEPLATEFNQMLQDHRLRKKTFAELFQKLANKYVAEEFRAISRIIASGQDHGGPLAMAKSLRRLGEALRHMNKMATERLKELMEPKVVAWVFVAILTTVAFLNATTFRDLFTDRLGYQLSYGVGLMVIAALVAMVAHTDTDG